LIVGKECNKIDYDLQSLCFGCCWVFFLYKDLVSKSSSIESNDINKVPVENKLKELLPVFFSTHYKLYTLILNKKDSNDHAVFILNNDNEKTGIFFEGHKFYKRKLVDIFNLNQCFAMLFFFFFGYYFI
jgi:hypothetical protein